jgi:hypothetical protein
MVAGRVVGRGDWFRVMGDSLVVAVDMVERGLLRGWIARRCGEREPDGGIQAPLASTPEKEMLNRSAVVVRPRKPFLDWVREVDDEDAPEVTPDEMGPMLYLVPNYEDLVDAEKVLKKVCEEIFCRELEAWFPDDECWPRDRSIKRFKEWFEIEHVELVEDVGRGPIENDEGPEEKHRFDPEPPPKRRPPPPPTLRKKKPRR